MPVEGLLDILGLFAEPFDQVLHLEHSLSHLEVIGFAADGVNFTEHFLEKEIQPPPDWFRKEQNFTKLFEMAFQPGEFFGDIATVGKERHLLVEANRIDSAIFIQEVFEPGLKPFPEIHNNSFFQLLETLPVNFKAGKGFLKIIGKRLPLTGAHVSQGMDRLVKDGPDFIPGCLRIRSGIGDLKDIRHPQQKFQADRIGQVER